MLTKKPHGTLLGTPWYITINDINLDTQIRVSKYAFPH